MKTAMQELKDWANQYKGQMISADQVVLQAHKLLEKEKEQIIDAHFNGMDKLATSLSEFLPIKHTMSVIQEIKNGGDIHEDGEQYYNETYKPETI
jgi:predicted metalloendopeptidase